MERVENWNWIALSLRKFVYVVAYRITTLNHLVNLLFVSIFSFAFPCIFYDEGRRTKKPVLVLSGEILAFKFSPGSENRLKRKISTRKRICYFVNGYSQKGRVFCCWIQNDLLERQIKWINISGHRFANAIWLFFWSEKRKRNEMKTTDRISFVLSPCSRRIHLRQWFFSTLDEFSFSFSSPCRLFLISNFVHSFR